MVPFFCKLQYIPFIMIHPYPLSFSTFLSIMNNVTDKLGLSFLTSFANFEPLLSFCHLQQCGENEPGSVMIFSLKAFFPLAKLEVMYSTWNTFSSAQFILQSILSASPQLCRQSLKESSEEVIFPVKIYKSLLWIVKTSETADSPFEWTPVQRKRFIVRSNWTSILK